MSESNFIASPGQLLLAARESRSLTQADIAKHMRLSVQAVDDIEHDAYAQLGVRTFVRGYLCAYARLVGVAEEMILASLEASGLMPDTSATGPAMISDGAPVMNVTRQYARFQPSRWAGVAVVALILVVVVAFWQDKKDSTDSKMAANTAVEMNKSNSDSDSPDLALSQPMNPDDSAKPASAAPSNPVVANNTIAPASAAAPVVRAHHAKAASHVKTANAEENNGFIESPDKSAPHTTYKVSTVTANNTSDDASKTS